MIHLYLWKKGRSDRLCLRKEPTPPKFAGTYGSWRYRVSSIFPALPSQGKSLELEGHFFIGFYFFSCAFKSIKNVLDHLGTSSRGRVWFSHGLASVIVFSENTTLLKDVYEKHKSELRAYEQWEIKDEEIIGPPFIWYAQTTDHNMDDFRIVDYSKLSIDQRFILQELEHCIYTAVQRSAQFIPSLLSPLKKLVDACGKIVNELLFLNDMDNHDPPASLPSDVRRIIEEDSIQRQRRIHQRVGLLVAWNSQLSYVISQAFSGKPPILSNECPIRSYSLLGVGTAFQALAAFSSHVETVFEKFPVDKVIADNYPNCEGVDVFKRLANFDPTCWEGKSPLDNILARIPKASCQPKLVAFSGRQGFRESESAIAVALPVLPLGDTARWNLMTITHELIHGHVRGLLGAIFSDKERRSLVEVFPEYYDFFVEVCKGTRKERLKLLDSIRFIIFNFCRNNSNFRKYAEKAEAGETSTVISNSLVPSKRDLYGHWVNEFLDINEIMAHLLDYNYFYDCQNDLYLGLLWASWSPVPAVLQNIDHYLLRSLVTIGSNENGTTNDRFDIAKKTLQHALDHLKNRRPDNLVAKIASERLAKDNIARKLKILFVPGLYLAEATKHFLKSKHIHSALVDDSNRYGDGNIFKYAIEDCTFPGITIESPVAFVADRLRQSLDRKENHISDEHRSCWMLLACASAYSNGAGGTKDVRD